MKFASLNPFLVTQLIAVTSFFAMSAGANAAPKTWSSTTGGDWITDANWGGTAPLSGDDLTFGGTASLQSLTNTLTNTSFSITGITFNNTGTYTMGGNAFLLNGGISTTSASGTQTINNAITLGGTQTISTSSGTTIALGGIISGSGFGITKTGDGTLTLSGANTYTGTTTVSAGILNVSGTAISSSTSVNVASGAFLQVTGAVNNQLPAGAGKSWTVAGTINNNGGSNTLSLAAIVTLNGGTLAGSATGYNADLGAYHLPAGGSTINANGTGNSISAANFSISNNNILTLNTTLVGDTLTASTAFINSAGSGTINKTGLGTVIFTGTNTNTASITVNGGTLEIAAGSLTGGSLTIFNGGTLKVSGGTINNTTGQYFIVGQSAGTANYTQTNGSFTHSHASGGSFFGNVGDATVDISGGSYTDTRLGVIGNAGKVTLNISGAADVKFGELQMGFNASSTGNIINLDGGILTLTTGGITGGAGTSVVNLNGGTLKAGSASGFTWAQNANVTAVVKTGGVTVDSNGNSMSIGQTLTAGSPSGGLTKIGGGTATLSGTNTYTGATLISGGTLALSANNNIAASSSITVGTGATLSLSGAGLALGGSQSLNGVGAVTGGTVITGANTSTIAPGMSPGTLTLSALNAANGGTFNFELGTTSDLLAITGALTGSTNPSDLNFNFTNAGGITAGTAYTLFTFGSQSGFDEGDLEALTLPAGMTLDPSFDGNGWKINANNLQVQFVPEPASALLGSLGLLALLRRRRN